MKNTIKIIARSIVAGVFVIQSGLTSPQSEHSGNASFDETIRRFYVQVPDKSLPDLKRRILATKWPARNAVKDRSQGVQLEVIQKLAVVIPSSEKSPGSG